MLKSLAVLALAGLLAGCGLAETGAAAAAGGVSKAEEARQAKQTEARIQQQIDAANAQAQQQRRARVRIFLCQVESVLGIARRMIGGCIQSVKASGLL